MNIWRSLKGIPRSMWLLAAATLINRTGTMVFPFLAIYLTKIEHTSEGQAGLVLTVYGIGSLITSPFVGRISDRVGKITIMEFSLILSGVVLLFYSFVNNFILILVITFIWSVINEAFRPANLSLISELVVPELRRPAFSLNRLAINLGMSIGPVIGGILIMFNFHTMFYADALTSIIAGVFLIAEHKKFVPERKPEDSIQPEVKRSIFVPVKDKTLYYFLLALLPVPIVYYQLMAAMPLFIVKNLGFTEAAFGSLMAINTVMIIFIEVPLNNFIIKWTHNKALSLGAFLCAIGFGGMVFTTNIYGLIITIVIWTFGEMIFFPSSAAYMSEISPPERGGEYMGYYQMTFSFCFMLGPWLGTVVFQDFGASVLWSATFVLGSISALMMFKIKTKPLYERIVLPLPDIIVNENTDE
jgi:MFS family permease